MDMPRSMTLALNAQQLLVKLVLLILPLVTGVFLLCYFTKMNVSELARDTPLTWVEFVLPARPSAPFAPVLPLVLAVNLLVYCNLTKAADLTSARMELLPLMAGVSSVLLKITVDSVMPDFSASVWSVKEQWLYLTTFAFPDVLIDSLKKIEHARNALINVSDARMPLAVKLVMLDSSCRGQIDVRLHVIGASSL